MSLEWIIQQITIEIDLQVVSFFKSAANLVQKDLDFALSYWCVVNEFILYWPSNTKNKLHFRLLSMEFACWLKNKVHVQIVKHHQAWHSIYRQGDL